MSMSMGDMGMGSMSMGDGVPGLFYLQKMYWTVVGSAIAAGTVVNLLNRFLAYQRLRDASTTPSKPKSLFFNTYATVTATAREVAYATLRPLSMCGQSFHFAPLGPVLVILTNLVVVLVFCFYKLDTMDQWEWEDVGYRTGFVAIAQLPLIFLLAGRHNLVGLLVGLSYERLNWFHRWISRTLWLTATIHMGFWFRNWARYDYITYQLKNDPLSKRGFIAWCILTFVVLASAAPIRRLSYEIFVLQHLVTFVGFIVAVWFHAPNEVKVWVWISIAFLVFDRVARYAWGIYCNLSIFHRKRESQHALWANRASFTPLPGNVTRITIENPVIRWEPGQHVFLSCHAIVPLQSHPFSIASIPSDNKMEFLVRAEKGGTRRFFRYASKQHSVLGSGDSGSAKRARTVLIEGPYGQIRPLRQFDSVVLLAGGMGATFTIPFLRDIVAAWKTECLQKSDSPKTSYFSSGRLAATKRIRFVWVIKSRAQLSWFESQLQSVLADMEECRRARVDFDKEVDISIYVTCDEKLDEPSQPSPAPSRLPNEATVTHDTDSRNEKMLAEKDGVSVHSVSSSAASDRSGTGIKPSDGCLPGGGCCCTTQIEDEDAVTAVKGCCCSGPSPSSQPFTEKSPLEPASDKVSAVKTHDLTILSGRPHPRTIIRKVLEKAEGESAVVACGPQGLSDDVRRSVVYLSDERAVHKGTGAQGIYLHVESFGW